MTVPFAALQRQQPLAPQIIEQLRERIEQRQLRPGARAPSIRQLARELQVSPSTVVEAYDRLAALGYLQARRGAGFFVTERRDRPAREHTPKVTELAVDAHWLSRNVYQTDAGALQAGCGWFPPDWFDRDSRQRALKQAARYDSALAEYGHPQGYAPLRRYLEDWLGEAGMAVPAEHILLTQGASQALDLVACCVARPGDVVLVDDPGYCNLLSCLTLRGFTVIGAPWTPHGPDTAALEQLLQTHQPKAFFTNPWLQNPTGASYSPATAYRVLQLAEQYGCYVVEDNVSAELQAVRGQTLAAMAGLARVIYIGSFSKTLSPGLRVGFVAAAPGMIDALTHAKMIAGLTSSSLAERLALAMLTDGRYRKNLERLKTRLAHAQDATLAMFTELGWPLFTAPAGGLFVWASPGDSGPDPLRLAEWARAADILLAPGCLFRPDRTDTPWLRFNVAFSHGEALRRFLLGYRRG